MHLDSHIYSLTLRSNFNHSADSKESKSEVKKKRAEVYQDGEECLKSNKRTTIPFKMSSLFEGEPTEVCAAKVIPFKE